MRKVIIYQLLPRLFGNDNTHLFYNGTFNQNGCGKMNDITNTALKKIKEIGITHIWYTGLLEHATQTDYSDFGIHKDHSAIVKGRAGSPYAVKDYYDIDPDLASQPNKRFQEFQQLLERTHQAELALIMDFVPNHVARQYFSDNKPQGVKDLGEDDCQIQAFNPQNNFYYIPGTPLRGTFDMVGNDLQPYQENPAKATGNNCFTASPSRNDWYETVKLNYGIDYLGGGTQRFYPIPDTWKKMLAILLFWAQQGVDGFRCDMAEMVPCEFWDWAISAIKREYPDLLFIGEVYNPDLYHEYIFHGHFDYLYDKVGLYDTLRAVTCGQRPASDISNCWKNVGDIQSHMLNFLENHDEQRLASDFYAGSGIKGKAAAIVSICMNTNPFMLYFGQEFGERGMDEEGFSGLDGRTTIFDYWSVKTIRKWRSNGKYQLKSLSSEEKDIYTFYKKILQLSQNEKALREGRFFDVMYVNYDNPEFDAQHTFAFIRQTENEAIFVVTNFSNQINNAGIIIPQHAFDFLGIPTGSYEAKNLFTGRIKNLDLSANNLIHVKIKPYSGTLLKIIF